MRSHPSPLALPPPPLLLDQTHPQRGTKSILAILNQHVHHAHVENKHKQTAAAHTHTRRKDVASMWMRWWRKSALVTKIVGLCIICPIHTALSLRSCTDTPPCRLCDSNRCGEGGRFHCGCDPPLEVASRAAEDASRHPCEWKSRRCGSEVFRSDGIHSLTAKQILHSSIQREMSHTSTNKAMLQDQTRAMW